MHHLRNAKDQKRDDQNPWKSCRVLDRQASGKLYIEIGLDHNKKNFYIFRNRRAR
jgi:hypothetical protein